MIRKSDMKPPRVYVSYINSHVLEESPNLYFYFDKKAKFLIFNQIVSFNTI